MSAALGCAALTSIKETLRLTSLLLVEVGTIRVDGSGVCVDVLHPPKSATANAIHIKRDRRFRLGTSSPIERQSRLR